MHDDRYHTPNFDYAWSASVTIEHANFQFGSDRQMRSLDEIQELVGTIVGNYVGHQINLLSEVTGKFNKTKLRFDGSAVIADDLEDSLYDVDMSTRRTVEVSVVQTRQREHTVLAA
jgi:hypothetical protein